tara:strand:- start:8653 stop:9453 length:801 start_codon:yes stop_codon:yes gene_type:complete
MFEIILLAIIQGITEFIPVSSSGHLILFPSIFGSNDQGLYIDIAFHFGSLLAVLIYFKKDLAFIFSDWVNSLVGKSQATEENGKTGWALIIATMPIVLIGYFLFELIENQFRSATVIAYATIGFGILLGLVDLKSDKKKLFSDIKLLDAFLIGLAQVLALIPGTSRSGITITAGLALGFTREAASRFSFLLAIPTISGAFILIVSADILSNGISNWKSFVSAAAMSAFFSYYSIYYFLRLIEKIGMWPFVLYRVMLGFLILFLIYK